MQSRHTFAAPFSILVRQSFLFWIEAMHFTIPPGGMETAFQILVIKSGRGSSGNARRDNNNSDLLCML